MFAARGATCHKEAMRARIILPAAALLVLAAALVFWVTRESSESDSDELEERREPQPVDTAESADGVERSTPSGPVEGERLPGQAGEPAGALPVAQPEQPAEPFDPATREHAATMTIHTAAQAMDSRNLKQLYEIMEILAQHRNEKLVSNTDKNAIEAAIACLESAPDADQEARDLLRYGGSTVLADNLRKACGTE